MKKRRAEALWIEARQRWQINVQRDGERKTFVCSTPGKQGKHEAEEKADKWLRKFSTEQRFCDAWDLYIADHGKEITGRAASNLECAYKRLTAYIPPTRKLSAITVYDWQSALKGLAAEGYAAGTIQATKALIVSLNKYALSRRWECEELREGTLQIPKEAGKAKDKQALSHDAYKCLYTLDDTDSPYIYLFQLLPLTGLRIGEALALEWGDISDHVLHLRRSVGADGDIGEGKTDNAQRNIPLIAQAESILDEQRAFLVRWKLDTALIFPSLSGTRAAYKEIRYEWGKVAKLIDTPCTLHELRHTYISIVKSVLPLPLLKQVVGHSASMDTLGVYAHELDEDTTTSAAYIKQAFADM